MKNFQFYETASACHITPLGHLERPREGYKSMTKPASGTFTNSTALRPSQGLHLATDHEYMLTSSSIFIHRKGHQINKGFSFEDLPSSHKNLKDIKTKMEILLL